MAKIRLDERAERIVLSAVGEVFEAAQEFLDFRERSFNNGIRGTPASRAPDGYVYRWIKIEHKDTQAKTISVIVMRRWLLTAKMEATTAIEGRTRPCDVLECGALSLGTILGFKIEFQFK